MSPRLSALGLPLAATLALAWVVGCGINNAPILAPIPAQEAVVADELSISLHATDADGDSLRFSFDVPELPNLARRMPPATLTNLDNGDAIFRFIPQASDARGEPYTFDFRVTDGKVTTSVAVLVTVRAGASGGPAFVQPLGSGTTLNLEDASCLMLGIEVNDTTATMVTFAQEAPLVDGATLTQDGAFTATFSWCPSAAQVAAQDRYYVHLSADDGQNPKTLLPPFLIVLIGSSGANCPGQAPVIAHTPISSQTTSSDIAVDLSVTDDLGLDATPLVYWALSDPGIPPSLAEMTPIATTQVSGDLVSGSYSANIPNPVANAAAGTAATVYYLLAARDNDDPTGGCNHTTYFPVGAATQFTVTAGAATSLLACAPCTTDAECGGPDDNCVLVGTDLYCGVACNGGGACPSGYACSTAPVTSADGVSAQQCLPTSGSCSM